MHPCFRWIALSTLAALSCGCSWSGDVAGKLVGKWESSVLENSAEKPAEDDPAITAATILENSKMVFVFAADGSMKSTLVFGQNEKSLPGKWKLEKVDGETLLVAMQYGSEIAETRRLKFTDNDHFEFLPPDVSPEKGSLLFTRVATQK